jgi:hypothetical protein
VVSEVALAGFLSLNARNVFQSSRCLWLLPGPLKAQGRDVVREVMNNQNHRPWTWNSRCVSGSSELFASVVLIDSPVWVDSESDVTATIELRVFVVIHEQVNPEEVFDLLHNIHLQGIYDFNLTLGTGELVVCKQNLDFVVSYTVNCRARFFAHTKLCALVDFQFHKVMKQGQFKDFNY